MDVFSPNPVLIPAAELEIYKLNSHFVWTAMVSGAVRK
jgi:hypothetical protein